MCWVIEMVEVRVETPDKGFPFATTTMSKASQPELKKVS